MMATMGSEIVGLFSEVGYCTIFLLFVIFPYIYMCDFNYYKTKEKLKKRMQYLKLVYQGSNPSSVLLLTICVC